MVPKEGKPGQPLMPPAAFGVAWGVAPGRSAGPHPSPRGSIVRAASPTRRPPPTQPAAAAPRCSIGHPSWDADAIAGGRRKDVLVDLRVYSDRQLRW